MALIIRGTLSYGHTPPDKAGNFYIEADSKYLSSAYKLYNFDEVYGEIVDIYDILTNKSIKIPEMEKREIKFILIRLIGIDALYINEKDWEILREYGIIDHISIKLVLKRVIRMTDEGKPKATTVLYSKRDIELA
jgi:hypothetical protein